jgi:hypothetical protein
VGAVVGGTQRSTRRGSSIRSRSSRRCRVS